jgi:23S rRNA (pseudouridine1915-N3)-methyltransferase
MRISLSSISPRRALPTGPAGELVSLYLERSTRYMPCAARPFATEARLLEYIDEAQTKGRAALILTDSGGQQMSSAEIAAAFKSLQDNGIQQLTLAIGPPDGWSPAARSRADRTIAFGRITLPHELALVVAAEQVYRALTILAGHPYHSGH